VSYIGVLGSRTTSALLMALLFGDEKQINKPIVRVVESAGPKIVNRLLI
jgi:xanthine/CO dehydrogenase XdhC/CoxF family maturation factor